MRGSQTFATLFETNITQEVLQEASRPGRSAQLHSKRNEAVADRYYFYGCFLHYRYDIVIGMVADDFFLSPHTIPEIIAAHVNHIQKLKADKVCPKTLSKKWPQYSWQL